MISGNIVDIVMAKIGTLPARVQKVVTIALFMRTVFDVHTLNAILHDQGIELDRQELVELLEIAI